MPTAPTGDPPSPIVPSRGPLMIDRTSALDLAEEECNGDYYGDSPFATPRGNSTCTPGRSIIVSTAPYVRESGRVST